MLQLELPAETRSVSLARRHVSDYCLGDACVQARVTDATSPVAPDVDLVQVVALLTTELVTNAVVHGGGDLVRITVRCSADQVEVTCTDDNPARPVVRHVDAEATGGRGMALIETLADEWGVTTTGSGKKVWFQVGRVS